MNPEQTRTTHDEATLTGARNEILDIATNNTGRLVDTRNAYIKVKGEARDGRGWRRGFLRDNPQANQAMEPARVAYEKQRNDFIQIEARRLVEEQQNAAGADLPHDQYRIALSEQVSQLVAKEMSDLTTNEITNMSSKDTRFSRIWRGLANNGSFRAVVRAGLGFGGVAALASGNIPLGVGMLAVRTGLSVAGAEGTVHALQNAGSRFFGDRQELSDARVSTMTVADKEDIQKRLASFAESRIRDRNQTSTQGEQRLLERYRELIRDQVLGELNAAGGTGLENWRAHRANEIAQTGIITTAEAARATAEAAVGTQEAARAAAEIAMNGRRAEATNQENIRDKADADKVNADNVKAAADRILSLSTDATKAAGGFIKQGENVARVQDVAKIHADADQEIARLRGLPPPPPAGVDTLVSDQEMIRDAAHSELYNSTWNVEKVVGAYKDRQQAEQDIINKPLERAAAEIARAAADLDANNQNAIRATAQTAKAAAEAAVATQQGLKDAAETARVNANNLSEDQAIMLYDILVGGGGGRAAVAGGRRGLPAVPNGLLSTETSNVSKEQSLLAENRARRRRWIGALLVGAALTVVDPGVQDAAGNGWDFMKGHLPQDWFSLAHAAEPLKQAAGVVKETASAAKEVYSGFKDTIPLPAGSNPWNEAAGVLRQALGHDATNSQIMQLTQEIARNSNIGVPNWGIDGAMDHTKLPVGYSLKLGTQAVELIKQFKGA